MDQNIKSYKDYLEKEKKYSVQTSRAYLNDVNEFVRYLASLEERPEYVNVEYDHVRMWIVFLSEKGLSNRSINRKLSALKSFYLFLQRIQQVESNPLRLHKSLKTEKKIQIPFSEKEMNEVRRLFEGKNDFESLRDLVVIEMLYGLGLRRAELLGIKISDVDFANELVKVCGKGAKVRLIPLLPSLKVQLKRYLEQREKTEFSKKTDLLIISKQGNKVSETFVYRIVNIYFSLVSSKEKRSPHMLRHTFATHLLSNGADINAIKELMGHVSLSSTEIYAHANLEELKKVYAKTHPRMKK